MNDKEKEQINELAKLCCNVCEMGDGFDGDCAIDSNYQTCGIAQETAKKIYDAGYRKVEETK